MSAWNRFNGSHADALVAAALQNLSLYQWSPVPQNHAEAVRYIDTALSWRDACTAFPFAIARVADGSIIGSTPVLESRAMVVAGGSSSAWAARIRCLRDRLHLARRFRRPHSRQHRGQVAYADACLRDMARAARLSTHRCSESSFPRRHRTHWREVRRYSPRSPFGSRLHSAPLRTLLHTRRRVAGRQDSVEGAPAKTP